MSILNRKLQQSKQTLLSPNSSSSSDSQLSYRDIIDKQQVNKTLAFVKRMRQAVEQMKKPKMSNLSRLSKFNIANIKRVTKTDMSLTPDSRKFSELGSPIKSPLLPQLQFKKQGSQNLLLDMNVLSKQESSKVEMEVKETSDEYLLGELRRGKKAHFNFLDSQDEMVHLYDDQTFQDYQDYLNMQKQIESHQKSKFTQMRQLLTKTERSIVKQKLQLIMWKDNNGSTGDHQMNGNDQMKLIREQRRLDFYVKRKVSEVQQQSPSNTSQVQQEQLDKVKRVKLKADNYIVQKFKHTGCMVQTLSKTISLKPVKFAQMHHRSRSPVSGEQSGVYQFNELRKRQAQCLRRVNPYLGRENRGYLQFDLQQINNYVDMSLN